jgi:hypothetical protein
VYVFVCATFTLVEEESNMETGNALRLLLPAFLFAFHFMDSSGHLCRVWFGVQHRVIRTYTYKVLKVDIPVSPTPTTFVLTKM